MDYPQNARNAWADAYAKKCTLVWKVVELKQKLALGGPVSPEEMAQAVAEKDAAVALSLSLHEALREAERLYYESKTKAPT